MSDNTFSSCTPGFGSGRTQDMFRACDRVSFSFSSVSVFFCFKSRPAHSATQIAASRVVALIVLQWRRTVHFINSYIIPSRSRPGQNNIVVHTHTPRSFALEDLYICKTRERAMFEHINHVKWRSGCYVLDLVISRKSNHLRNIQISPSFWDCLSIFSCSNTITLNMWIFSFEIFNLRSNSITQFFCPARAEPP